MATIIDRTNEEFPSVVNAEYLEYKDDSIPDGVKIIKSNIFVGEDHQVVACKNLSYWGWVCANGYNYSFKTPEAALADYLNNIHKNS
jgi:hypothetical protein